MVLKEISDRGYETTDAVKKRIGANLRAFRVYLGQPLPWDVNFDGRLDWFNPDTDIFKDWHNDRYLTQCYYNLQEKWDRGGIPFDEWADVKNHYILLGGKA